MSIEALAAQITALDSRLTEMVGWVHRLDERHRDTMYGNGKPGMLAELERLKASDQYRDRRDSSRSRREWAMVGGVLLILAERAINIL